MEVKFREAGASYQAGRLSECRERLLAGTVLHDVTDGGASGLMSS